MLPILSIPIDILSCARADVIIVPDIDAVAATILKTTNKFKLSVI